MSENPWPDQHFNSLEDAFAYYTECALATAEGLEMRKSAAKHEKRRARGIANNMVAACARHGVERPGKWDCLPRLRKAMGGDDD
jgi:hypothetical protein